MKPLGEVAIGSRHFGDLRQHFSFGVGLLGSFLRGRVRGLTGLPGCFLLSHGNSSRRPIA
jgi:hypothetical protein